MLFSPDLVSHLMYKSPLYSECIFYISCFVFIHRPLVPSTSAANLTHQDSGLRISTCRGKQGGGAGVSRESLDGQPGSEAFYSPSASHDTSPLGKPVTTQQAVSAQ